MIANLIAIAAGGALGALARFGGTWAWIGATGLASVYATATINVIGSACMGGVVAFLEHGIFSNAFRNFLTVGILGGFTTFSTFSLETVGLWLSGHIFESLGYAFLSVSLSIAAFALVYGLMKVTLS